MLAQSHPLRLAPDRYVDSVLSIKKGPVVDLRTPYYSLHDISAQERSCVVNTNQYDMMLCYKYAEK